MKNLLLLTIIITVISCNGKNEMFDRRISELETLNKKMQDSLKRYREDELTSKVLIGITEDCVLKANQKNRITFVFYKWSEETAKYKVYREENGKEMELKFPNATESGFKYDFIPKSKNDNVLKLRAEYFINDKIVSIPGELHFKVEE